MVWGFQLPLPNGTPLYVVTRGRAAGHRAARPRTPARALAQRRRPGPPGGDRLSALGVLRRIDRSRVALLYGRAGRLAGLFGGFRPGQASPTYNPLGSLVTFLNGDDVAAAGRDLLAE